MWIRRGLKKKFKKRILKSSKNNTNEKLIFLTSCTFVLNRTLFTVKPRYKTTGFIRHIFSSAVSDVIGKVSTKKKSFRKKSFYEIFVRKISYLPRKIFRDTFICNTK